MSEAITNKRKLLSITTGVRNDHYVANYSWRVSTILNYIAFGLERIGRLDDVEIVVADWNSPTPMVNELKLSAAAQKIARFFDVPAEVAVPAQLGNPFPIGVVLNASARHASGEFVCMTDNDCLYTPATLDMLCRVLEGSTYTGIDLHKAVMAISRRQVVQDLTLCSPSVEEIDYYLSHYANMTDEDKIINGMVGAAGSFIMHRSLWDECGAYDEKAVFWGWSDIDLVLRTSRKYPWINLSNFGLTVYHLGHPLNFVKTLPNGKKKTTKVNVSQVPFPFLYNINGKNWGQGQFDLALYASQPCADESQLEPLPSSQAWRLNKLKGLSWKSIKDLVTSDDHRKQILEFLTKIDKGLPFKIPGCRDGINRYQVMIDQNNPNEWDYLSALAWYCRNFFPLTYVEAGVGRGLTAFLAAYLYPPISIYGFESWDPFENPLALHPITLGQMLSAANHRGYLRYLSEQSPEAYSQFWRQSGSPVTADLIVYANSYPAEWMMNELRPLVQHLAIGGCLILKHLDSAILKKVIVSLKAEFPTLAWFANGMSGMGLNIAETSGWSEDISPAIAGKWSQSAFGSGMSFEQASIRVENLLLENKEEEAVALISAQIQAKPTNAAACMLMGNVLNRLGLPRNAQYYFERAILLEPNEMAGYTNYSIALARAGDSVKAEKVMRDYLEKFPDQPVMLRLLGDVLTSQNRHDDAFEVYKKLLVVTPNEMESLSCVANCALEIGDLAWAQNTLENMRNLRPGVADIEAKWNTLNERISTASDTVQKILTSKDFMATVQQNMSELSADVIYVMRYNAEELRAQGDEELAASYESLAQSLQNLILNTINQVL